MDFDFFISHSREVKMTIAIPIAQNLTSLGFRVWIDRKEIVSGGYIYKDIRKAISKSEYCIAIIDSEFLLRSWPQEELNMFHKRERELDKLSIIPIYVNIDKEQVFRNLPWLEGRAFEKIVDKTFERFKNQEILCRIIGSYYERFQGDSFENIFDSIKKFEFPCKETLMTLYKDKEYYSTDFRIAIIETCNIGGIIYAIYKSSSNSPNVIIETTFNLCMFLQKICFDVQYVLTYNIYISVFKAVTAAAEQLKVLLDSLQNS